jgi:cytochrome P450
MEDMSKLPYVNAVVLETLRQHPPEYMIGRCATEEVALGSSGYTVAKGTTAIVSPYLLHHSERWERPELYTPERWMALWPVGEEVDWHAALRGFWPNGSYLPFGSGPRKCIGTSFGFVLGAQVLATILQRFRLVPAVPGQPFPDAEPLITLRPRAVVTRLRTRVAPSQAPAAQCDAAPTP